MVGQSCAHRIYRQNNYLHLQCRPSRRNLQHFDCSAAVSRDAPISGGVGVTGTGATQGSSLSEDVQGMAVVNNFSFSRPNFEEGISYARSPFGAIGALLMGGTENLSSDVGVPDR